MKTIALTPFAIKVADIGQLARRVRVAMDRGEFGDLAGGLGLRLGGADLLLAEAVADAAPFEYPIFENGPAGFIRRSGRAERVLGAVGDRSWQDREVATADEQPARLEP